MTFVTIHYAAIENKYAVLTSVNGTFAKLLSIKIYFGSGLLWTKEKKEAGKIHFTGIKILKQPRERFTLRIKKPRLIIFH